MPQTVQQIVDALSDEERLQLITDHRQFERDGSIGACLLRTVARRVADEFGDQVSSPVYWMEVVANAAYRNFALRFIRGADDGK
jgi:hypothetical protein